MKWASATLGLGLLFAGLVPQSNAAAAEHFQTYILAVGSGAYIQPASNDMHGFENLPGVTASARLVARLFATHGATAGITLTSSQDGFVSRTDIANALSAISSRLRGDHPADPLLIVYIAGHGISEGVAWTHFSVPGNFVYGAPLDRLDVNEMARHTTYAGDIADDLDRLHVPYVILLDSCYSGHTANLESPILSATAIGNLRDISTILRTVNEFHQSNPVIFSAKPGTEVPLAPDPRDPAHLSLAPLARRLLLVMRSADSSGSALTLSQTVAALVSSRLDPSTTPPITYTTPAVRDDILLDASSKTAAAVEERQGTATAPDICCGSAPVAPRVTPHLHGALMIVGPTGEFLSDGGRISLQPSTSVEIQQPNDGSVELGFAGSDAWELDLAAPSGQALQTGRYLAAQRYGFEDAGHPGLALTGAGRACNDVAGEFTLADLRRDSSGNLSHLDVTFLLACDGEPGAARGRAIVGSR